jgi:hypothetical protein
MQIVSKIKKLGIKATLKKDTISQKSILMIGNGQFNFLLMVYVIIYYIKYLKEIKLKQFKNNL